MPHARMTGTAWDRRKEDYAYTRDLDRSGWAWEFLRRNEAYQRDVRLNRAGHPVAIQHISGAALYRPRRRFLAAEAWGLELFADPDKTAVETGIFWLPRHMRHAVRCSCEASNDNAREALSLASFRGRRAVLAGLAQEHVTITQASCSSSLIIEQGSMLFGKAYVTFLHGGLHSTFKHHENMLTLRSLTTAAANPATNTDLPNSKWLEYLIALDGRLAGRSYREIAEVLYGSERVRSCWFADMQGIKSKVIRACKNGLQLMNRGYLKLL